MFRLTDNQLLHRQYLESPIWKAKRQEALNHYGCICARCQQHGTDVHHKTYERWGGDETMEDLEVLCRPCHEAHHRAQAASRSKDKHGLKGINRRAIYSYLTFRQRRKLMDNFSIPSLSELSYCLGHSGDAELVVLAARMLGFDYFYGKPPRKLKYLYGKQSRKIKSSISKLPRDERLIWMSFDEFKNKKITV